MGSQSDFTARAWKGDHETMKRFLIRRHLSPGTAIAFFILIAGSPAWAAERSQPSELAAEIRDFVAANQNGIVRELAEAVSIPSVASDRENIRRKAEWLRTRFERRGFEARLLETGGNPLVFAELDSGAGTTVLLYCHYDGQPVDPARWDQESPWTPVMRNGRVEDGAPEVEGFLELDEFGRDWRLYARTAADDTSPIIGILAALDALRATGRAPTVNLKVILDGEEEAGSPSLVPAIARYRELLASDLMLILDGPIHASNRPTVVFGARGIQTVQLTAFGPRFPLHSGHFGNWAPNPAQLLARLLASMKDDSGKVLIEGFYDEVEFDERDREVMAAVPDDEEALRRLFGIAVADAVGSSLQEARNLPSLNVRGMQSAWVGDDVRTVVPSEAVAEIDLRLVPETHSTNLLGKLLSHIRAQGWHVVEEKPTEQERSLHRKLVRVRAEPATEAYRTPLDDALAARFIRRLQEVKSERPILIRTSGGTVPISPFIEALGFPALSLPIVNFDNNQHSPNENVRLGHFFEGIVSIAAVLTM